MLKLSKYVTGVMQTNVYFAMNGESSECVIIDPAANARRIIAELEDRLKARPVAILLTHGHFDHIMAVEELREHFNIPVYAAERERELLAHPAENLSHSFRLDISLTDFIPLKDGDVLSLAGESWRAIETPGHTAGSLSFYVENDGEPLLFSGDTLFLESFGRTDFPGGSERELLKSINERLLLLPDETRVYPGHEGESTIAHEKKYNPAVFLYAKGMGGFSI